VKGLDAVQRLEWLASIARDSTAPGSAIRVAIVLAKRQNKTTGRLDPSISTIASEASLSRRSVHTGLRWLEQAGFIDVSLSPGGGRQATNSFALKNPEPVQPTAPLKPVQPTAPVQICVATRADLGTLPVQPAAPKQGIEPGKNQEERTREANAQYLADTEDPPPTKGVNAGPGGKRGKRATPAPDHLPLTETLTAWGRDNAPGIDLASETERFLDHHRAKGSTFRDWTAAWRNWMRKAVEYQQPQRQAASGEHADPYELIDHREVVAR